MVTSAVAVGDEGLELPQADAARATTAASSDILNVA
jgi:hypothetical protein